MENTDAAVADVKPAKADLVDVVNEAFENTGPAAIRAAMVQIAERVQALEQGLGV